ncbi:MAG TPA: D-2-hydroxyacid dehydrogenase [Thermoleophilia bacterium]|nr:D-2-hydroxyacid dehydrogenase [Thermoleophilia bacterium]
MNRETLLVLGPPAEPLLARLKASAADFEIVAGTALEDFEVAASAATIIFAWGTSRDLLRQVLLMSPKIRWVHIFSAGMNHLMSTELVESPAVLTNAKGVFSQSLGEWVLGAILYFAKDFRRLIRSQMQGRWDPYEVVEISGQTVGIVGYGDIGQAVAKRVAAMGMRVLGLTRRGSLPNQPDPLAEQIYAPVDLIRMIEQSDYIIVTAPLTPETRNLVGEAEIAAMKPDAVIINIGRGPVINEEALIRALSEKKIKGAALDVFHREPLPGDHPFYSMENVLLSPHCADNTPDWLENAMEFFLENLDRYRKGEPLLNLVQKELGY